MTPYLYASLARRFAVHATMTGLDRSERFAETVRTHCRRFVVSDRQTAAGEPVEPDAAQGMHPHGAVVIIETSTFR
jgi:hypothetical protein